MNKAPFKEYVKEPSGASKLIKLLQDSNVIIPVTGYGKGKYRFWE